MSGSLETLYLSQNSELIQVLHGNEKGLEWAVGSEVGRWGLGP